MSVQNVRNAIERFLRDKTPQVLCVRGAWGTGKTYTWDDVLRSVAKSTAPPAFEDYAYISLFGLNSLQEIKREIFQNTAPLDRLDVKFELKNIRSAGDLKDLYTKGKSTPLWFKAMNIFSESAADTAIEATSLLAREQLICIDDLERKGEDLRSADVLGYISHLRDKKDCSVILLLNDEQLEDREEFEAYLEKVVDINLRFEPTCQEIADIAVPESERDEVGAYVWDNAVRLSVNNVRVIRKILRLVREIQPMLSEYSAQVTKSAASTITLMGWAYLQPEQAPSLDYISKMHNVLFAPDEEKPEEQQWAERLKEYGYTHTDEFDLLLLKSVKNGYFVKEDIDKHAVTLHQADIRNKTKLEIQGLWKLFRGSFISPEEELRDQFFSVGMRNIKTVALSELVAIEAVLSSFDDPRGLEILERYIEVNKDVSNAFDMSFYEHFEHKLEPNVRERLLEAMHEQTPNWSAAELLQQLDSYAYRDEIQTKAAAMSVEEYIAILKGHEGEELAKIVKGLKKDLRLSNPSDASITIMDKAGMALREIAKESTLAHHRAMATGLIQRLELREAKKATSAAF